VSGHDITGHLYGPNACVAFCRCGLSYFGGTREHADERWQEHIDRQEAAAQAAREWQLRSGTEGTG